MCCRSLASGQILLSALPSLYTFTNALLTSLPRGCILTNATRSGSSSMASSDGLLPDCPPFKEDEVMGFKLASLLCPGIRWRMFSNTSSPSPISLKRSSQSVLEDFTPLPCLCLQSHGMDRFFKVPGIRSDTSCVFI